MTAACNPDGFYVFKLPRASMRVCMITKQWTWQRLKMGWTRLTMLQWNEYANIWNIATVRVDIGNVHHYMERYWKFHPFVYWIHGNMKSCQTIWIGNRWQAQKDEGRIFVQFAFAKVCCYDHSKAGSTSVTVQADSTKHISKRWCTSLAARTTYRAEWPSHWVMSLRRLQCTQKKDVYIAYIVHIGKRCLAWYGTVPPSTMLQITS